MKFRSFPGVMILLAAVACTGVVALGQSLLLEGDVAATRDALADARKQGNQARIRAERLEAEARRVTRQAERTAREGAAIAARIQEAEAEIDGRKATIGLIEKERDVLLSRLAERQQPVIRLTAALQRLSRRPPVIALLRPGSVRETMYMRALLDTMLPEVERRTAALKTEIKQGRELEAQALAASRDMQVSKNKLKARRQQLATIESRQRLASRDAEGIASREADRALALAEKALDLTGLVSEVGKIGELREQLALLPGPVMRPARPERSLVLDAPPAKPSPESLDSYMLPVSGRIVSGFGEKIDGSTRSRGIVLAARSGAQAVAPAQGRVAFAGPYSGYGQIVIIEHDGGWTSLVTGLVQLDTRVGALLVAGSPIGLTGSGEPIVTVELRREGEPVNPMQYIKVL